MKSYIRNIGNSEGIILITSAQAQKRKGWPEQFQEMAENGDDELIIPDVFNDEDLSDWIWKEI